MAKARKVRMASEIVDLIAQECDALGRRLVSKHREWGDTLLNPTQIFSKGISDDTRLGVHIDGVLARLANAEGQKREDLIRDLLGFLTMELVRNGLAKLKQSRTQVSPSIKEKLLAESPSHQGDVVREDR